MAIILGLTRTLIAEVRMDGGMVGGWWREVHWKCNVLSTVQLVEASKKKKQLTN